MAGLEGPGCGGEGLTGAMMEEEDWGKEMLEGSSISGSESESESSSTRAWDMMTGRVAFCWLKASFCTGDEMIRLQYADAAKSTVV